MNPNFYKKEANEYLRLKKAECSHIEYKKSGDQLDKILKTICAYGNNYYDNQFSFIYLGETDEEGHRYGWMSDKYIASVLRSIEDVYRMMNALGDDYTYILLADHGGHDRIHGHDIKEDMTIPVLIMGENVDKNHVLHDVSIKDLAPTIVSLMEIDKNRDWEGKELL